MDGFVNNTSGCRYDVINSFLADQQANLENIPPAENRAKILQSSPALSKPDAVCSSATSQEITMGKLAGDG